MQEIATATQNVKSISLAELLLEDKQRLVDAFVWLLEEDKKQNPELYQRKTI